MRSGCRGIRVCRRRRGSLAAALIVLAACGDNLAPPRLSVARFVYDDGSEQIDRAQLYDRQLELLCTPERLSDGNSYCVPDAGEALYVDAQCSRAVGRVIAGEQAPAYFATSYAMGETTLRSHFYPTVMRGVPPTGRYELRGGLCIGPMPLDDGYDYYAVGAAIDLARVRFVVEDDIEVLVTDGARLPWRFTNCALRSLADQPTASCAPFDVTRIAYYGDASCSIPLVHAQSRPSLAFIDTDDCRHYFEVGNEVTPTAIYEHINDQCVTSSVSGDVQFFSVSRPTQVPTYDRAASGATRLQPIAIGPLVDELMHDTVLDTDCRRDATNRCVPAGAVTVESWFADSICGTPIEVAMVPTQGCGPAPRYARRGDDFFAIGDEYTPPLYQLEPGDRCGLYVPPSPFVAHSLGASVDTFARATLVIP